MIEIFQIEISDKEVNPPVGQYSRDSFDRFGDDLSEVLLSYLRFEDKLRLECLSKQWKRLIFNKQRVLVIAIKSEVNNNVRKLIVKEWPQNVVDITRLKSLLKKCQNIRRIEFRFVSITDEVLDAIIDFCPRLESIRFAINGVSEEVISRFGQKLGQRIKSLEFNDKCEEKGKLLITFCPNFESFKCNEYNFEEDIFEYITEFAPKLRRLDLKLTDISVKAKPMTKLIVLKLNIIDQFFFFDNISLLAPNLKRLELYFRSDISDQSLYSLSKLQSLTHLVLHPNPDSIFTSVTDSGVCHLLEKCSQLNTINFYFVITSKTIDKLIEIANKRPKDWINFFGFRYESSFEFNSSEIPKNLKIEMKDIESNIEELW